MTSRTGPEDMPHADSGCGVAMHGPIVDDGPGVFSRFTYFISPKVEPAAAEEICQRLIEDDIDWHARCLGRLHPLTAALRAIYP